MNENTIQEIIALDNNSPEEIELESNYSEDESLREQLYYYPKTKRNKKWFLDLDLIKLFIMLGKYFL